MFFAERLLLVVLAVVVVAPFSYVKLFAQSTECQDVLTIYARGSGNKIDDDTMGDLVFNKITSRFNAGVSHVELRLGDMNNDGRLDAGGYPAQGMESWVGVDFGHSDGGENTIFLKQYNSSRATGTRELVNFLKNRASVCTDEKIVLAGHSQGAHVIGAALSDIPDSISNRIVYVALFGDPKFNPDTVQGMSAGSQWAKGNFRSFQNGGILGARKPYIPPSFGGKVGSWCDRDDFVCTTSISGRSGHSKYVENGYVDAAANIIATRLKGGSDLEDFKPILVPMKLRTSTEVDVAFVVDATNHGSIGYETSAGTQALADKISSLPGNPRVAVVTYGRAVIDNPAAKVGMLFSSDPARLTSFLTNFDWDNAYPFSSGYLPAVSSGLMTAFHNLDWRPGATKMVMLLGGEPGVDPEPGSGYTFEQVLNESLRLDPVVINVVHADGYANTQHGFGTLAEGTGGMRLPTDLYYLSDDAIYRAIDLFMAKPVAVTDELSYSGAPGEAVTFNAAGSYAPSSEIVNYAWDFNYDGIIDEEGPSPIVQHAYDGAYNDIAVFKVTSADGSVTTGTVQVNVSDDYIPPAVPDQPGTLSMTIQADGAVEFNWQSGGSDIVGYRLYDESGEVIGMYAADATSATFARDEITGENYYLEAVGETGVSEKTGVAMVDAQADTAVPEIDFAAGDNYDATDVTDVLQPQAPALLPQVQAGNLTASPTAPIYTAVTTPVAYSAEVSVGVSRPQATADTEVGTILGKKAVISDVAAKTEAKKPNLSAATNLGTASNVFWQQHTFVLMAVAVGGALLAAGAVYIVRRPKQK